MRKTTLSLLLFFSTTMVSAQVVAPLPDEAWSESEWICVADAPEVHGRVNDHTRAADGAN